MTTENQGQVSVEEQVEAEIELETAVDLETEASQVDIIEGGLEEEAISVEAEPVDESVALREQLTEAQSKADEYLDGWQRSRAEFANYRRREEQRQKQMDEQIKARVLGHLLPVMDDLERAFQAVPEDARDSPWGEGLSLVEQKLHSVLEKEGLSVMSVQSGDVFDPNYHEAVSHEPSEDFGEGRIVDVWQRGYKFNDIVLRPALVRVSSGKLDENEGEDE